MLVRRSWWRIRVDELDVAEGDDRVAFCCCWGVGGVAVVVDGGLRRSYGGAAALSLQFGLVTHSSTEMPREQGVLIFEEEIKKRIGLDCVYILFQSLFSF